jgi:iron(III) transport system substrate-binding protein
VQGIIAAAVASLAPLASSLRRRSRVTGALATLLAGAVVLSGCSSPTADEGDAEGGESGFESVLDQIEGLSGKQRTERLIELAEAEGAVLNLYTSLSPPEIGAEEGVPESFGDTYDIDVSVFRGTSEVVFQRLLQEAEADFPGADVVETNGPELSVLNERGLLAPYESDLQSKLVEGSQQEGWTADRFNKFAVSWNTDLVDPGEQPTSWEDLANPRWDGTLALEATDSDWYKALREYWIEREGKSEAEADELFERIARNATVVTGHSLLGELLAAGEFEVAASNYRYLTKNLIERGAPVSDTPQVEPVFSRANGVALLRDAQHPATAILFVDWLISDGQEALLAFHHDPARRDLAGSGRGEVLVDIESYVAEQEKWTERYERLLSLGEAVPAG